jgi:peptidoglycan/LPS O-acetylase OafA/YrhL
MSTERRPALDALRTVVVVGLVFFHAALVFDASDDFYVKNSETTGVTTILAGFGVVWAMPLLFAVAGIGAWHSLGKRGPGRFAAERLLRLGVPLVFATLTIVPVPQWLRLRADPAYDESYWQFLPRFFDVRLSPGDFPFLLQGEYFETGHLWFVVLLLAWSLLLAAAVRWLPHPRGIAAAAERPGMVLLAALPIGLISAVVGLEEGFAAWSRWAYLIFFVYGFTIASDDRIGAAVRRHARLAAVLGPLLFAASAPAFVAADGDPFQGMGWVQVAGRFCFGLSGWFCLVAILGFLDRPARPPAGDVPPPRRVSAYLAVAALPLYVLHQPIVVAVAYRVVPWDAPIPVEWAVIVVISLILLLAIYDLLVRRTAVTRFLFGMRPATQPADPRTTWSERTGPAR